MLRIATRKSDLALWQAKSIQNLLERTGQIASELVYISTQGDLNLSAPFNTLDGRGFFTKELENSLLEGRTDLAVHSLKDLPTTTVPGLKLAAVLSRADRRDVLLARREARAERTPLPLREGARLGTSSVRRRAQASLLAPDLEILELRGNVPTRVRKLREGHYDAIVLAKAGLDRLELDLSDLDITVLELDVFLPAPGQAALAIEIRSEDPGTRLAVEPLDDARVRTEIEAERGLLNRFAGGCNLPLGAYAEFVGGAEVRLSAFYAAYDRAGRPHPFRSTHIAPNSDAAAVAVFADLLAQKSRWARTERALAGCTVAVTRPETAVDGLKQAIEDMGGSLLAVPTLAFEALSTDSRVSRTNWQDAYDWVLFTSQNAVHFFRDLCPELPPLLKVGAVGAATAHALSEAGWNVDLLGTGQGGGDFATQFLEHVGPGRRVLWPTGESRRTELPDTLVAGGVTVDTFPVYRTVLPPVEYRLQSESLQLDWILVTSPEAGKNFVELYGRPHGARWAALGPTTQGAMQSLLGIPVAVARETSLEALAEVLV
jgi:hydroxymethylbilane synthase